MPRLTKKQAAFVAEYLACKDVAVASEKAGYSLGHMPPDRPLYYVYFLVDPGTGQIFYVGKGIGQRVFQHVRQAQKGKVDNSAKYDKIKTCLAESGHVDHYVFSEHKREDDAYEMERYLIEELAQQGLTNMAHGIVTENQAAQREAQALLEKLKPYDVWVATIPQDRAESCIRVFGSLLDFYTLMDSSLRELAAGRD